MESLNFPYDLIPSYQANDFTWYYHPRSRPDPIERIEFDHECSTPESKVLFGDQDSRLLVCSCFRRTHLSCTIRRMPPVKKGQETLPRKKDLATSGYLDAEEDRKDNLNTADEICTTLRKSIFGTKDILPRGEGLIIVTGSTNAGKSIIARGLIHKYLQARLLEVPERRPHLVTFEDPIEVYFAQPDNESELDPTGCFQTGIDYTPREVGTDVVTLNAAINDALRQTPEVFYMSEVRDGTHWDKLVDFAGTGHLVVTTAHAGSLQEAMRSVFRATRMETPAGRSVIAERIAAVVHLRAAKLPKVLSRKTSVKQMIVPAVWRHTPEGVMAIMECGLSSVLPDRSSVSKSSLGRAWFVEQLISAHCQTKNRPSKDFQTLVEDAAAWDLQGR